MVDKHCGSKWLNSLYGFSSFPQKTRITSITSKGCFNGQQRKNPYRSRHFCTYELS